jgi:hypothetical protein
MLRRMFGSERDEVTGGLRKLHNEELHNLYTMSGLLKKGEMGREFIVELGQKRRAQRILVGKSAGKMQLGIHRCSWLLNIKRDLHILRCI